MIKPISFRPSGDVSLSSRITVVLFVAVLLLLSAQPSSAQGDGPAGAPASSNPQTELQLLRELIDEVRKLRSALLQTLFFSTGPACFSNEQDARQI